MSSAYQRTADTGGDGGEDTVSCKACRCGGPPCAGPEKGFWGANKNGAWNGLESDLWDPTVPGSHIVQSGCNENNIHSDKFSERAESHKEAAPEIQKTSPSQCKLSDKQPIKVLLEACESNSPQKV